MLRKCLVLMALVMLLMPLAGAGAQSDDQSMDYCAITAEPDCQILMKNEAVMAEVHAVAFNMGMSLHLLTPTEGDDIHMLLTGDGSFAVDPEAASALESMEGMDAADAAAMMAMVDSLLTGIEGELALLSTQTITDHTGAEEVFTTPINMVMENGVYALDTAAMGEDMAGMEGMAWFGLDLTGAVESMMEDPDFASMLDMESDMSGMIDMDYSELAEAMTITRLPDEEINGVAVAVFDTAIDYDAMLGMFDLAAMYAMMGLEQEQAHATSESLKDAVITVREHIGLEDFYTYSIAVFMDDDIAVEDMDSLFVSLTFSLDLSDFNAPVDVEIPEDAVILPYGMMMAMNSN